MRRIAVILVLSLSLICLLPLHSVLIEVKAPNGHPVHNLDTGLNYTSIQEAIGANETLQGHTIFVEAGIYLENIVVNKAVRLVGENRDVTILDGSKIDTVTRVTADNVSISGFTIQNSGSEWLHGFGVDLRGRRNCRVENCTIQNNGASVYISYAANNTIENNIIANASVYSIMIYSGSRDNNITKNTLIHNHVGVEIEDNSEGNIIAYNNISLTSYHAVYILHSNANFVLNNRLSFNGFSNPPLPYAGIKLMFSSNNTLANNLISNNTGGIQIFTDKHMLARYNIIMNNTIENNDFGVVIDYYGNQSHPSTGTYNKLYENTLQNNDYGIYLIGSDNNTFYHNNFLGSIYEEAVFVNSTNTMNSNFEGNYWSNYTDIDSNNDGIGDTPHVIDEDNQDNYPLMGMFHNFYTSVGEYVNVISNSTIDSFRYFEPNGTIRMHVSNMTADQTHGFCRMSIPYEVMSEPFTVTIDGANPTYWNYTLYDNGTHRWIYFEYEHSTSEVIIIPEFPSFLTLPLFLLATLMATIFYRRKLKFLRIQP